MSYTYDWIFNMDVPYTVLLAKRIFDKYVCFFGFLVPPMYHLKQVYLLELSVFYLSNFRTSCS
jgi:hypothetical protein